MPDDPETRAKMRELRARVEAFDALREPASVKDFVDHIDHAVKIAGIDHVGISSDFDGGGVDVTTAGTTRARRRT